jgi:glutathione S-transferase
MITLYTYGPAFKMPDPSPFVMKVQVLLRMSKLEHDENTKGMFKAPKGRMPYIKDNGTTLGDSTFIRFYLEQKYKVDFDAGLSPSEKATSWAFEKMCEEHLYFAVMHMRWMIPSNFKAGPEKFFKKVPAPIRPFAKRMAKKMFKKLLDTQGTGAHSQTEIETLAIRDLHAISDFLGDKKYLMGDKPCAADATVFAFVASTLCPVFESPIRKAGEERANLRAYTDRLMKELFPEIHA